MFRWEVKESSPLNRPNSHFNYERAASTPDAHRKTRSTDQKDGLEFFPGTLPNDGRHAPLVMTSVAAQLKSPEHQSRPSPNPVLAMTQQMAAMTMISKPYYDIAHVSYNVL